MMHLQELMQFMRATIECSYYLEPTQPGLTYQEVVEACTRVGYQEGEVGDAFPNSGIPVYFGGGSSRLESAQETNMMWGMFWSREEPEFRNFAAFDFVVAELNSLAKSAGAARARIERSVLVARATAAGHSPRDTEAAISIMIRADRLAEKEGVVFLPGNMAGRGLPSAERNQMPPRQPTQRPARAKAYPIVQDIIARRTDTRPSHAEPLDAFAEQLAPLGYGGFLLWWTQTVAEMRRADPNSAPLSVTVLAAALVEGALTFVVRHGRTLGAFMSSDFDKPARLWKIDDLVNSAGAGGSAAILDEPTRQRAVALIQARQRIHAGRMLIEFPTGVPDLRPEEARDARATADLVIRRVLDWLAKHPPS